MLCTRAPWRSLALLPLAGSVLLLSPSGCARESESVAAREPTRPLEATAPEDCPDDVTPPVGEPPKQGSYAWKNVRIDGGGFVPGIVFSPAQRDLIYARTDIGGAYRWDAATKAWIPLLDWVGRDKWGYNGVVSIAADPVDANRVYAAVGMYTNSWDPNPGAILRSKDRGKTWEASVLPFKLGGNMPGRGMGERLAIDPNDNEVLYFGAPSGKGLWRSGDQGVTWARVDSFTALGDYVQDPNFEIAADKQGLVWVAFDTSTGSAGKASQTIYVGVADKTNPVYRSTDGGKTWAPVAGAPKGYLPHRGVVDPTTNTLYIATSDTGGPYDGSKGDVWKYEAKSGSWKQISPIPSSSMDDYFGYSGLTIDRQHPSTIMVATQVSYWPDVIFFRSTDAGATWSRIWEFGAYPERKDRFRMDITENPWLTFGTNPQPPEHTPKLGWMTESLEIDPFDSSRMMYGTGATIYTSVDLSAWDTGGTITIKPMAKGLEETAVLDLVSPPEGAPLLSAMLDLGGFRHDDLTKVPKTIFAQPVYTAATSLDYAELKPSIVVRAGNFKKEGARANDSHVAFSTDGGANWFQGSEPAGIEEGGTVAAAADGSRFVWAPRGVAPVYAVGFGNAWQPAVGLPKDAVVESDRVDARVFYGFSAGTLYVSTDGGATFRATAAKGLPAVAKVKPVASARGDLWLAGGKDGLFHSTDAGETFRAVPSIGETLNIGFGKAAAGAKYPALYTIGTVGGVQGVFRSDDSAASWTRVNDDANQWGNIGEVITGDPRVYGRVYVGTNGRGIVWGEPR